MHPTSNPQLNLLPQWAKDFLSRRKLFFRLAAVQLLIFIAVGGVIYALSQAHSNTLYRTASISQLTSVTAYPGWTQAHQDASAAMVRQTRTEEFFELHNTYWIDSARLNVIFSSIPMGAYMRRVYYSNAEMIIIAATHDIYIAFLHSSQIADTNKFYSVEIGDISLVDYNLFTYHLRVSTYE